MGKKNSPFYNSKRDDYNKKHTGLLKQEKSKLSQPLLKTNKKKKSKNGDKNIFNHPLLKQSKSKKNKTVWNTPLLKQIDKEISSEEKKKQLRRLHRFINNAEKRGYEFENNIIDTSLSAEKLSQIKPDDLYKKARFLNEQTGEYVSGEQGKEIEKLRRVQKAKETREKKEQEYQQIEAELIEIELEDGNDILDNDDYELDKGLADSEYEIIQREKKWKQNQEQYEKDFAKENELKDNTSFHQSQETPAHQDVFNTIEDIIYSLRDGFYTGYGVYADFSAPIMGLQEMWHTLKEAWADDIEGLYDYLTSEQAVQTITKLYDATYDSKADRVKTLIDEFASILNYGTLNTEQQIQMQEINDYYQEKYGYSYDIE